MHAAIYCHSVKTDRHAENLEPLYYLDLTDMEQNDKQMMHGMGKFHKKLGL